MSDGKRSNPCAWYVGPNQAIPNVNAPFCGKQSVSFVGGKPYCPQHRSKAEKRLSDVKQEVTS